MAEYNEQSGYIRQGDKPTSTYNAHQDEFGFKEGNENPNSSSGYGDTDSGVGGPKSGYGDLKEGGTFDHGTSEQTQFGLEGKTGSYGHEGADPQLGGTTDSRPSGAPVDPMESNFDKAPRGIESVPAGDGWGAEDTSPTHGAKKDGLVNKIKQKLPGQHNTADGGVTHSDPNAPPKKSIIEKVKEKLPGQHGSSDAGI